ncbi:TadE/TadG family type IV pilus assembly protein [Paenibacillus sp. FSL H8-0548]|uniref:TadE/TadG family type IV pilus assembly protein n=1 Tax=Paenibacillus sp. FSL H8-0548 TaxID=1920422 RepID=UPI00117D291A|nr:TadE/TadG family type IV pilus assembly protein [Paenibacillus sp. FSL H8-0548]
MRRHRRLAAPINYRPKENERGSIVVEAALVMPMIIVVLLVFVTLIRLCAVQMALHSAASQTVRQIAAHIHPIELAWQQAADKQPVEERTLLPTSTWSEIAAEAAEWLPDPAGELVSSALRGDFRPLQNMAATEIGRAVVEPLLKQFADAAIIDQERLSLGWLSLPDLDKENESYLTIAVEYEFPLKLPFYNKPIILKEQASERVWISDALPARYGTENNQADHIPIQIVAIEPTPLRPGRKATVTVKTVPGAAISLGVMYKSGSSKAKHLGEATADADGYVKWTWHVSGNTTPGIWELTASEVNKESNRVAMHFVVEKSSSGS